MILLFITIQNGMKKLIFLVVIGFAAWYYHENHGFEFLENLDIKDFKITASSNLVKTSFNRYMAIHHYEMVAKR